MTSRGCILLCLAFGPGCLLDIPDPIGDASLDAPEPSDAVFDVQTCTTLDAGCIPAIPSGWVPLIVADAGCGSGWASSTLETNPRLDSTTGCACSCAVSGGYDCSAATLTVGTGNGCATTQTVTAGACNSFAAPPFGFQSAAIAGGTPTCSTSTQPPVVDTDPLITCAPISCNVDFCGASGRKCIAMPAAVAQCPMGFPILLAAGTGSTGTCGSCDCAVSAAPTCGGLLLAYNGPSCSGTMAGFEGSPGNCLLTGIDGGTFSLKFNPSGTAAAPTCSTMAGSGPGSASLTGPTTICCTN